MTTVAPNPSPRSALRVLHVTMGIDPRIGGTVTALTAAVTGEVRLGARVTVLVQGGDISADDDDRRWRATRDELVAAGAVVKAVRRTPLVPRDAGARLGLTPQGAVWMARNVAKFDVVQVHGSWGFLPVAAAGIARLRHVPVVLTAHESLTQFGAEGSRSRLRRAAKLLLRPLIRGVSTTVVFTSPRERDDSGFSTDPKARILPNGIVLGIPPALCSDKPSDLEALSLAFVGRLHPKKNLDVLIRAVAEDTDTVLAVAGDVRSSYGASLQTLAIALGAEERVIWCGFLEPADRQALLRRVDALVLPSQFENFGMAAAEAMAEGTPVIISPFSGIAATVGRHGGGLVADPTSDALRAAFEQVRHGGPLLTRAHTRGVAESQLSCEAYALRALQLYESLSNHHDA